MDRKKVFAFQVLLACSHVAQSLSCAWLRTSSTSSTSTTSTTKDCLNSCSGLGSCNYETNECMCRA
eukprot:1940501-Amphidinium_carterae.1